MLTRETAGAGAATEQGADERVLIGQITDIHLGFEPDAPDERNRRRLDAVVAKLAAMNPRPDLVLATGDLADRGEVESYRRLREALSGLPCPVFSAMGNHDRRAAFAEVFADAPMADGFVHYPIDLDGLSLIVIDTLEEGRHGGAFCTARAEWLGARLAERRDRAVVIVMHHPPLPVGIAWMDPAADEPWIARFRGVLAEAPQVRAILCGHVHRPIASAFAGVPLLVCPSTAPQLALDLAPIDPEAPDGRPLILADAPGFAMHRWDGERLVSHVETAGEPEVIARYDAGTQGMVRGMMAEVRE